MEEEEVSPQLGDYCADCFQRIILWKRRVIKK